MTKSKIKPYIYLDYNSTAPLHPSAWQIMEEILCTQNAAYNASSLHYWGQKGRKYIENARKQVAKLVGADTNQVIFNSGATEGNNTVLMHFAKTCPDETIIIIDGQHPSIMQSLEILDNVKIAPIDENGLVKIDKLEELCASSKISLLSCPYANNETGVIQNIPELSKTAHKYGALFHCDGTQAAGKIQLNIKEDGIDFLTLSSHKIGGAQGVGALIIGICTSSPPTLLFGGRQEKNLRAGTQNIAGIAGFGAAAKTALTNLEKYQTLEKLRDELEDNLRKISPDIIIHAKGTKRIPNTSFFSIKGVNAQNILMALDLEKIAISSGSACSSGSIKPSSALTAMGVDKEISSNALRISMGWATKKEDIDIFLHTFEKIIKRVYERKINNDKTYRNV